MSTLGDTMSTSRDVQYIGVYHDASDIMIHVGGYHEYIQYKSKAFIKLLSNMNHDVPPMYSWCPPDVLMVSPRCTHGIPPMYWTPHSVLMISPTWIMISLPWTEHPPMYWTHIIQGETIQILILKPNTNEQVILSTLNICTGFSQACLFWKKSCGGNQFLSQVPVFIAICELIPSQWGNAIQPSKMPRKLISLQPMRFHMRIE